MTLVTIDLQNAGYETSPDDRVVFYSPAHRNEQGTIISTAETSVPLVDGQASKELAPGTVVVQILAQGVADTRPKSGHVPESGPVSLWDVILDWTPALVDQGILAILAATDSALGSAIEVIEGKAENAQFFVPSRDGNIIRGKGTALASAVPETVTSTVPKEPYNENLSWPALTADGKIPISLLPQVETPPLPNLEDLWGIIDASVSPPPMPRPDSLSASGGVRMSIPTHDGSGQAVHPYVRHFPQGIFGFSWWMAVTGYAGRSTEHEDPHLLASHTGLPGDWVVPPGVPFPLDDAGFPEAPQDGYNSDPCLEYDPVEGRMYVFWRRFRPDGGPYVQLLVRSSTDGKVWTAPEEIMTFDHWHPGSSPYFIIEGDGTWKMFSTRANTPGQLEVQTATDLFGPWSEPEATDLVMPGGLRLWHCEVRRVGQWWLALAQNRTTEGNGGGDLRIAASRHPTTGWEIAELPVTPRITSDHQWLYQGTALPYVVHGEWKWRLYYSGFSTTGATESWLYYTELEKK